MTQNVSIKNSLEILEQRIAPAGLLNEEGFRTGLVGTPLQLTAGQGLSTGGVKSGTYLLYVEKGSAVIFTTDFNNNNAIDFNEITGISAGDGLRLISFVDIHGDIVTNLRPNGTLSDSNNDPTGDDPELRGDGRVLLNSRIESIQLRSLTVADIGDQDNMGSTDENNQIITEQADVVARLALSSYSIFGNVLTGRGFGVAGDLTSGLTIDLVGKDIQQSAFIGPTGGVSTSDFFIDFVPQIGSIKTGTAANGTYFSFGVSSQDDIQGRIATFNPPVGQAGGDIVNVRAASAASAFNLDSLEAGEGGIGGRGGNVQDIQLNGDSAGGYRIIAGNGGRGVNGGAGGSILNLNDFGAATGEVVLKTGDGGNASTGTGGSGGSISFGELDLNGDINVFLGNGGDGFIAGGNGASLTAGTFTVPEGGVPFGLNIFGTTRDRSTGTESPEDKIGTTIPVDFNEDNFGDFVYTSSSPSQLVVVLGRDPAAPFVPGPDGFLNAGLVKISLDSPVQAESLVVGDFNSDGHQDIAAGSMALGNFAGISVYLSQYEDTNNDGVLSDTEDLNGNGVDDFLGFDGVLHSALPTLLSGDSSVISLPGPVITLVGANQGAVRSANAIGDLAAGDFDGDGNTDLAVVATYFFPGIRAIPFQVTLFLTSDVEDGRPTGKFFANFGTKAGPGTAAEPLTPLSDEFNEANAGDVLIEASALTTTSPNDVLFLARKGTGDISKSVTVISYATPSPFGPTELGTFTLGNVDTNRRLQEGNNRNIDLADATVQDFTLLDFDGDNNTDLVVLTQDPSPDFLVAIRGNGGGGPADGDRFSNVAGQEQNRGIALSPGDNVQADLGSPFVAIKAADTDGNGRRDNIAALDYGDNLLNDTFVLEELTLSPRTDPAQVGVTANRLLGLGGGKDTSIVAFDIIVPVVTTPDRIAYAVADPARGERSTLQIELITDPVPPSLFGTLLGVVQIADSGLNVLAGNGGNALIGRGGIGGSIGGGLTLTTDPITGQTTTDGALEITFPDNLAFRPLSTFAGGDGGNGFSVGGKGGNVTGLTLRRPGVLDGIGVTLLGGDGGFGVAGVGGEGGDLSSNSIQSGDTFAAGNGGRGLVGGAGGSITGNGLRNIYDARVTSLTAIAGIGGNGVQGGGAGGSIMNFRPEFSFRVGNEGFALGSFSYTGGAGGSAVSGAGGRGGSVMNSSPRTGINTFDGEISVTAGNGGRGLTGGAGGDIANFINQPSTQDNPTILSFLAGDGGAGVSGNGGAGGSIQNIDTPSIGSGSAFSFAFAFDRLLAGNGGNSAGAAGGAGGTISGLSVEATDGSMVIAAGAGGRGLTGGGVGGGITNSIAGVGGSQATKLLVIAGAGGDSTATVANPNDAFNNNPLKAFGGKVGQAGNGGSITGFRQELGISTRVDLIAGNGGSTVNFGTITPGERNFVGRGGSIANVTIAGNIGNIEPDQALKSYNNTADLNNDGRIDETIAEFVQNRLRTGVGTLLTDDLGNVGAIVGAAGRVKAVQTGTTPEGTPIFDTQPADSGINGSLLQVSAKNLLSAVAGSIDRIASIQLVSGLRIGSQLSPGSPLSPGVVGADKFPSNGPGMGDYFTREGILTNVPILEGRFTNPTLDPAQPIGDGAIVASQIVIQSGDPNLIGRVFVL